MRVADFYPRFLQCVDQGKNRWKLQFKSHLKLEKIIGNSRQNKNPKKRIFPIYWHARYSEVICNAGGFLSIKKMQTWVFVTIKYLFRMPGISTRRLSVVFRSLDCIFAAWVLIFMGWTAFWRAGLHFRGLDCRESWKLINLKQVSLMSFFSVLAVKLFLLFLNFALSLWYLCRKILSFA